MIEDKSSRSEIRQKWQNIEELRKKVEGHQEELKMGG